MVQTRGQRGQDASPLLALPDTREARRKRFGNGYQARITPTRKANTADAAVVQATSSEDAVTTTERQPTPPTTTSRSQSPHLDTESDSPTQVPESRSTSPPITFNNRRTLRSHTRSVSPSVAIPKTSAPKSQQKRNTSTTSKKPAPKLAPSKKRGQPEPDTSEDEVVATSNNNTTVAQRRIKRIRTGERVGASDSAEALFAEQPEENVPAAANDSSADDDTAPPAQPPKHTRSRSTSRPLPAIIENNSEDAGSEDSSSDAQRPAEANKSPGRRTSLKVQSTTVDEPMVDDLEVRTQILQEQYGLNMPNLPPSASGVYQSGNQIFEVENNKDGEDDWYQLLSIAPTPKARTMAGRLRASRALIKEYESAKSTPMSKDRYEVSYPKDKDANAKMLTTPQLGNKEGAIASSSGPSTKSLKFISTINAPTTGSFPDTELQLTDNRIIEHIRILNAFYAPNSSHTLPSAEKFKQLLIEHEAREAANITPAAASSSLQQPVTEAQPEITVSDHSRIDQQQLDLESGALTNEMSDDEDLEQDLEEAGEVPNEVTEPKTPTQQTPEQQHVPQSSRWYTKLASPFATISRILSKTPTTNRASVTGDASNAHLIPRTSDLAPPTTPTNARNRRRPQTEHKPPRSAMKQFRSRPIGPQTERKKHNVRFDLPVEQRDVLTPEQVAEIHRKQDAENDRHARERQERRTSMRASVEDADDRDTDQPASSAQPGEKRKRYTPVRYHNSFVAPDPYASDDDISDNEDDAQIDGGGSPSLGSSSFGSDQAADSSAFGSSTGNIFTTPSQMIQNGDIQGIIEYKDRQWSKAPSVRLLREKYKDVDLKNVDLLKLDEDEANDVVSAMSLPDLREAFGRIPRAERWDFLGHMRMGTMRRCEGLYATSEWPVEIPLPPGQTDPRRTARYVDHYGPYYSFPCVPLSTSNPFLSRQPSTPNSSLSAAPSAAPTPNNRSSLPSDFNHVCGAPQSVLDGLFGKKTATPTPAASSNPLFPSATSSSGATITPTPPTATPASSSGLFGRVSAPAGDPRIGTLAARAHDEDLAAPEIALEQQTEAKRHTPKVYHNTIQAPDPYASEDDDSSDIEDENGNENANQPEAQPTRENAADSALQPLDPLKQTPPPKPKPSHAELPQVLTQPTAIEIAKAQAEKYKPKKSSGLSNVTMMTPPHGENKENRLPETEVTQASSSLDNLKRVWLAEVQAQNSRFDLEVLAAVDAAVGDETEETQFRAEVADVRRIYPFELEVMGVLDGVLPA